MNPYRMLSAIKRVLDTPIPIGRIDISDKLTAAYDLGRREGLEEAAKVADSYDFMHPDTSDDFCKGMASGARSISTLIRGLRDTPAAPETGKETSE